MQAEVHRNGGGKSAQHNSDHVKAIETAVNSGRDAGVGVERLGEGTREPPEVGECSLCCSGWELPGCRHR